MFYGGESNVPGAPGNLLAGNPLMDPRFKIPGTRSGGQPVLPGENKKDVEDVYGRPGMKQMPGFSPFQLPSAMGAPGMMQMGNIGGMLAQSNLMTDPSEGLEGFGIFSPRLREKLIEKEQMREHFPSMRSIDNFPQMQMFGNNKNGYGVRF
jgi:hypothetical protein